MGLSSILDKFGLRGREDPPPSEKGPHHEVAMANVNPAFEASKASSLDHLGTNGSMSHSISKASIDTRSLPAGTISATGSQDLLTPEEDEEDRGEWGNQAEFLLSCLGYAVGLGNVWRFPYMCFENGGGAFLIPYIIMLVFVGIPCFFIELTLGQYSGSGPATAWVVSPLFRGIGIGMIIISFIGSIYYNMIITYSLYYLFASFAKVLPWDGCKNSYNSIFCYSKKEAESCEDDVSGVWFNQTCFNKTFIDSFNTTQCECPGVTTSMTTSAALPDMPTPFSMMTAAPCESYCNETYYNPMREYFDAIEEKLVSASEEYYNNAMLRKSPTMDETGSIQWDLALVLLLAWVICFLCILKGIKSSGKVVYFTATFPYLVLVILFFRGVTLPGAGEGIKFYIIPKMEKLANGKVWVDAAGQIFFSLSVGMGGLMTFASYNKFNTNVFRDTLIVSIGNCLTSVFAGFVIFSILGFMAHELGKDVEDVARSGTGLAFIAYPEVITRLPISQLWSFLFFFMLLTLGLDSQFAGLETIQTAIVDVYPRLRPKKTYVALALSILMFLLGLTQCTNAGVYWMELMSYYSSGWSLVLIGLCEAIVIPWVYGADNLMNNIEDMVGFRIHKWWWFCWKFITPTLLIVILIFNLVNFTPLKVGDYELPGWAQTLGWMITMLSVLVIPAFAIFLIVQSYRDPDYEPESFWQRLKDLSKPSDEWRPSNLKGKKVDLRPMTQAPVCPRV